jgi:LmbE family N-acetylglucosaminyl deacetylase
MKTLIIAPHPDDELLGCAGTLLRRVADGGTVGWLLMTEITQEYGWKTEQVIRRAKEIELVRRGLGVHSEHFFPLAFPAAQLDQIPMSTLVSRISDVFKQFEPEEVLLPYSGDIHSDHRITFEAASACTKWFRYSTVRRVLSYETPSETDFNIDPRESGFKPNFFVNIVDYLDRKIELLSIYQSEVGEFPFPRSGKTLKALAQVRGSQAGFDFAEAFITLSERS